MPEQHGFGWLAPSIAGAAFFVCVIITAITGLLLHWPFAAAAVAVLWFAMQPPGDSKPKRGRK